MDSIMNLLTTLLIILIFAIVILLFVAWYMSYKNKQSNEEEKSAGAGTIGGKTKVAKEYTKKSIFQFMQFDKIEDNMIIQDDSKKYLMVVECEGINYDLMSQVEKTAVEAGFVQFLNTLRHPIQIYTQTRTINISDSITNYTDKIEETKKELEVKQATYSRLLRTENYNEKQAEALSRDIIRLKNLYEYGNDVVENIQKTSQNKNVLRKHYYIVIPYYSAELAGDLLDEEERKSMIFSELYTRAQSLIRTLSACSVKSRVLNSNELVELLYIAYNRDESDIYSVTKAIRAGYNELYSTAPDVVDKKMKALNEQIEKAAFEKANQKVIEAKTEKQKAFEQKQENQEDLIAQLASIIVEQNRGAIGNDIADNAIEKIQEEKQKRRGRPKKQTSESTEEGGVGANEKEGRDRSTKTA